MYPEKPHSDAEQIGGGLRGSTHHIFRSSWIDWEVRGGRTVVGVGEVADRGVGGSRLANPVDRQGDRASSQRGGEQSPGDAPKAGSGTGAVCVAVVAHRTRRDFAWVGGRRVVAVDRAAVGTVVVDDL